uniref:Putative secreted protein n=1 Tax=Anopheles triannulatus TaxID=58253 RepID=A0A2M4B1U3_9DIPT
MFIFSFFSLINVPHLCALPRLESALYSACRSILRVAPPFLTNIFVKQLSRFNSQPSSWRSPGAQINAFRCVALCSWPINLCSPVSVLFIKQ